MRYLNQNPDGSDTYHYDGVYEDEVSQRDPVICSTPEDKSQGEERVDNADQQQPTIPSRLQRQKPSRQGRVAYVIYGGIGDESGVYYNWASCEAVIERYYRNSAPPYVGFNTEIEARTSFESFQTVGQLPPGIFFPALLQPLNGPPVPLQPRTPQRRNRPPTTVSPSPSTSPRLALLSTAVRSGSIQHNLVPASTQARQPSRLAATSSLPLLAHVDDDLSFYVVIEGPAPGIYGSQATAFHARGLQGSNIAVYTTREAANQAFVDAYMTGRVGVTS